MHVHCHTGGSMEIPKHLPFSSVNVASFVFLSLRSVSCTLHLLGLSSLALSLSMLLTISNTCDALHGACILSITVRTCDTCTYHGAFIAHRLLVHTVPWAPQFAVHCLCTCDTCTYCQCRARQLKEFCCNIAKWQMLIA